jgi:hypothetical protein
MMRYAKSHTHIDLARRSSIMLHMVIEQAPFLKLAEKLIPGLQWDHKASSLTCTFGLQEHSASGGKKHMKNNDH